MDTGFIVPCPPSDDRYSEGEMGFHVFVTCRVGWMGGRRRYRVKVGGNVYARYLAKFRELSGVEEAEAREAYRALLVAFLSRYGVAEDGYHLPPGVDLPAGMVIGLGGKLEELPVEPERPLGACWDD